MNTVNTTIQDSKTELDTVYVALMNEGSPVWRPTKGKRISEFVYQLLQTENYDPEDEEWEFPLGSIVRCEYIDSEGGRILVAKEKFNPNG